MSFTYIEKPSASPYVDVIWHTVDTSDGTYLAAADGSWDMIFTTTKEGQTTVRLSGPSSTTTPVHYKQGNRNVGMRLKQGAFFTHIAAAEVVDVTEYLPMPSPDTFLLGGHLLHVPSYETMDNFIAQLENLQLLSQDPIVRAVLEGAKYGASRRSVQRRFGHSIGLTPAYIAQIERAWRAVELLQQGAAITAVVHELGYADQAHLNRTIKKVTGYTPRQNAKRNEPL
ncbi:MAG TPA: helix-turn-helix domain-containing protein [Candidatus Saccharimonadales bacterium]